jgi:hypothetical protein
MKSPRHKNVAAPSMPSSPTFSVFGSPQMQPQMQQTQTPLLKSLSPSMRQSSSPQLSPSSQLRRFQNLPAAAANKWGTRTAL